MDEPLATWDFDELWSGRLAVYKEEIRRVTAQRDHARALVEWILSDQRAYSLPTLAPEDDDGW